MKWWIIGLVVWFVLAVFAVALANAAGRADQALERERDYDTPRGGSR